MTYRTVALSQQVAPGVTDGVAFTNFDYVVINSAGNTAFHAFLTYAGVDRTSADGIWAEHKGGLELVMRAGTQPPGVEDGVKFQILEDGPLLFNDADQVATKATLTGPSINATNYEGIWSEGAGHLALVARLGSAAPGTISAFNYYGSASGSFESLGLNAQGNTAFTGIAVGAGANPPAISGIWSGPNDNLRLVARKGLPAIGLDPGVNYAFFENVAINGSGQVAFDGAGVTDGSAGQVYTNGIWSEGGGTLRLVARQGATAPGVGADLNFLGFGPAAFNDAGETAFYAALSGPGVNSFNGIGIWSEGGGALHLIAQAGAIAPGTNAAFGSMGNPILNGAGQTALLASLIGASVNSTNDTSIWSEGGGPLHLIAREGSHAPGTPAGVSFADLYGTDVDHLYVPAINRAGNVAFWAYLTGTGVNTTNNRGIWAEGPAGVTLIAREGDLFQVGPGDVRTIADVSFFDASGNEDGGPSSFNDRGQLAFAASFTDGTSGVFVANVSGVPEPATTALVLTACLFSSCFFAGAKKTKLENVVQMNCSVTDD